MKIKTLFYVAFALFFSNLIHSQVGIGTTLPDPSSILDISSTSKGLLLPRMSATEIAAIVSPAKGLLIFNTTSDQIVYNTGTSAFPAWRANTASNGLTATSGDIKLGGVLTASTTISGVTAINKLIVTATGIDAINLASSTLSIDATNNRVGIGTATPLDKLHLEGGNMRISQSNYLYFPHTLQDNTDDGKIGAGLFASGLNIIGVQTIANQGRIIRLWGDLVTNNDPFMPNGNAGTSGQILQSTGANTAPIWANIGGGDNLGNHNAIYRLNMSRLPIIGAADSDAVGGTNDTWSIFGSGLQNDGSMIIQSGDDSNEPILFRQSTGAGSTVFERMRVHSNGFIGIGTASPTTTLDINGTIKISGGSPGANKVLTSNSTGVGSWTNLSTLGITTASNGLTATSGDVKLGGVVTAPITISAVNEVNKLSITATGIDAINLDSNTLSIDATSNRVGIGTASPEAIFEIIANKNSSDGDGFRISSSSTGSPILLWMGASATNENSFIQAYKEGIGFRPLLLNSLGGNVGIGTASPTVELDVVGQVKISGGTPGAYKVLTSNATGVGTWEGVAGADYTLQNSALTSDITFNSTPAAVTGLTGITATYSGKYMIIYHYFLTNTNNSNGMRIFTCNLKVGETIVRGDITQEYVTGSNVLAGTYTGIVKDVAAGQVIKLELSSSVGLIQIDDTDNAKNYVEYIYMGR